MTTLLHAPDDYPPGLVLRATLALDLMAFTEFAFGVVPTGTSRPLPTNCPRLPPVRSGG
jgi:hypothetical protein